MLFHRTVELKENTTIVVLGASGDLAKKKTVCQIPMHSTSVLLMIKVSRAFRFGWHPSRCRDVRAYLTVT